MYTLKHSCNISHPRINCAVHRQWYRPGESNLDFDGNCGHVSCICHRSPCLLFNVQKETDR